MGLSVLRLIKSNAVKNYGLKSTYLYFTQDNAIAVPRCIYTQVQNDFSRGISPALNDVSAYTSICSYRSWLSQRTLLLSNAAEMKGQGISARL